MGKPTNELTKTEMVAAWICRIVAATILLQTLSSSSDTYLRRFARWRDRVLKDGERLRLVEAGNRAQGRIFRDDMHFWTGRSKPKSMRFSPDFQVSSSGGDDVRFRSVEEFRAGRGFEILEFNGAASEATSAYDASKSLREAYKILFRQWSSFLLSARRTGDADIARTRSRRSSSNGNATDEPAFVTLWRIRSCAV